MARNRRKSYPKYYRLIEHENLLTVIKVDNIKQDMDVMLTIATACQACPHIMPGDCIRIEATNFGEWSIAHA